jgi:hypothetical protein
LLFWPPTVTSTGPVEAVAGTGATIVVLFHVVGVAVTPPNLTVLPVADPKYCPEIVTAVPMGPDIGDSPLTYGGGGTIAGIVILEL